MRKYKKIIIGLFIILSIIILVELLKEDTFCTNEFSEYTIPLSFKGVVLGKYISNNHDSHYIYLNIKQKRYEMYVPDLNGFYTLYDFVKKGDSLYKQSGDSIFYIYRSDSINKKFIISCKNEK